jgi:hypothetical protein
MSKLTPLDRLHRVGAGAEGDRQVADLEQFCRSCQHLARVECVAHRLADEHQQGHHQAAMVKKR